MRNNAKRCSRWLVFWASAFFISSNIDNLALADEDPAQKGLQIVREMERRDEGWQNATADLTMTLFNKHGETTTRQIRSKALEVIEDGDKSLLIFDSPLDVKNTVFLNIAHKSRDDDQWIFLPALKRVKRIASSTKGGSFMGSEFSYEDMSTPVIEKYNYLFLREDVHGNRPSFVVERIPNDPYSLYSKQIVWIDQEHYIPWQIEYYDRAGTKTKTLTLKRYKRYLDKYWRSGELTMSNHVNGKKTVLLWENFNFKSPEIKDSDFSADAMDKIR